MPVSGGGFEQAYNGQIGVDGGSHLIVCQHVSQQPNDKQELVPALDKLAHLPEELGKVETASTDTGYFSEDNVRLVNKPIVFPLLPVDVSRIIRRSKNAWPVYRRRRRTPIRSVPCAIA
jgi:hypothetical protein